LELDLRYGEFKWEFLEEEVPIIIKAIEPVREATLEIVIAQEAVVEPEVVVPVVVDVEVAPKVTLTPEAIATLKARVEELNQEIETACIDDNFELADQLQSEIDQIELQIN